MAKALPTDREQWDLIGRGRGIAWDGLDLHLSAAGLLEGARESVPATPKLAPSPAGKPARRKSA